MRTPDVWAALGCGGRVPVLSCGTASSGIPSYWAATDDRPGVDFVPDLSVRSADALRRGPMRARRMTLHQASAADSPRGPPHDHDHPTTS